MHRESNVLHESTPWDGREDRQRPLSIDADSQRTKSIGTHQNGTTTRASDCAECQAEQMHAHQRWMGLYLFHRALHCSSLMAYSVPCSELFLSMGSSVCFKIKNDVSDLISCFPVDVFSNWFLMKLCVHAQLLLFKSNSILSQFLLYIPVYISSILSCKRHSYAKRLLFFSTLKCLFPDRAIGPSCFRPRHVFFSTSSFFSAPQRGLKKSTIFFSTSMHYFELSFPRPRNIL